MEVINGYILTGIMSGLTPFESIKKLVFDTWRGKLAELLPAVAKNLITTGVFFSQIPLFVFAALVSQIIVAEHTC